MKKLLALLITVSFLITTPVFAKSPKVKFYDFQEQLIDGDIKKPTTIYTDAKVQVRFERLLSLKKSFISALLQSSKERVFK
jgi:hypothetical protein